MLLIDRSRRRSRGLPFWQTSCLWKSHLFYFRFPWEEWQWVRYSLFSWRMVERGPWAKHASAQVQLDSSSVRSYALGFKDLCVCGQKSCCLPFNLLLESKNLNNLSSSLPKHLDDECLCLSVCLCILLGKVGGDGSSQSLQHKFSIFYHLVPD